MYDEWNVWFRNMTGGLEERYVFHDALAVGLYLNIFVRHCAWVAMANMAQMVNAIAPVVTSAERAVVQPIYYPFLLHAKGHLGTAVDAFVDGPTVEAPEEHLSRWEYRVGDLAPFTLVDATATVDTDRRHLALTLINRSEQEERTDLVLERGKIAGPVQVTCVTGTGRPSLIEDVEEARCSEGEVTPTAGRLVVDLPARSFTLVAAKIEG